MRIIFYIIALFIFAGSVSAQRISSLPRTNSVAGTNTMAVSIFPNALTNGTWQISIAQLLSNQTYSGTMTLGGVSISSWSSISAAVTNAIASLSSNATMYGSITNINFLDGSNVVTRWTNNNGNLTIQINSANSGGSGSGATTNSNQFGAAGNVLTIINGAALTNANLYSAPLLLDMTAERVLTVNASQAVTASSVTETELAFLSGVSSAIQTQFASATTHVNNADVALTNFVKSKQTGSMLLSNLLGMGISNIVSADPNGLTIYTNTGVLVLSNAQSAASGENNVNGEISATNATMFGLVASKASVTNRLRSIAARNGLVGTNEGGTNISFAIDPAIVAINSTLTNYIQNNAGSGTNASIYTLNVYSNLNLFGSGVGSEKFYDNSGSTYFALEAPFAVQTNNVLRGLSNATAGVLVAQLIATGTNQLQAVALTAGQYLTFNGTVNVASNLPAINTYATTTISGAGNGNTNYTLLANADDMYLGSSNVNISAVMNYGTAGNRYWTATITNLSAISWGIGFSSVTNRWKFSGVYGTNAPTVLTNGTMLFLAGRSEGTNSIVGYTYYAPGL